MHLFVTSYGHREFTNRNENTHSVHLQASAKERGTDCEECVGKCVRTSECGSRRVWPKASARSDSFIRSNVNSETGKFLFDFLLFAIISFCSHFFLDCVPVLSEAPVDVDALNGCA